MFTFEGRSLLLKSLLTPDDVTPLTTVWLALATSEVLPADDGDSINEVIGAGYQRRGVQASVDFWTLVSHGALANAGGVYWDPALEDWGLITWWAMCTSALSGRVLAGGPFAEGIQIHAMGVVALAPGMLILEVNG